jgi:pyruvate formate lyase activating enzyme
MTEGDHTMRVGGIVDMSTVDWYGNVSLVLFMAGCNIRCPYCQNSELLPIDSGEEVDFSYLEDRIKSGMNPVPQLDSLVITGGEPLLQPESIVNASRIAKKYGLKVMLDTNGTLPDNLTRVLDTGLIDRVALDIKAPINGEDYGVVTGRPGHGAVLAENLKKTLNILEKYHVEIEFRTTVAPELSDNPDFIKRIAKDIKRCDAYYLQQFSNQGEVLNPDLKKKDPPSKEHMIMLAEEAIKAGVKNVYIKTTFEGLERISL